MNTLRRMVIGRPAFFWTTLVLAGSLHAVSIDAFSIVGSPTFSDPNSSMVIEFSGLQSAGVVTLPAGGSPGSISLLSLGAAPAPTGLIGALRYDYDVFGSMETDFRFLNPGGVFAFSGPTGEWRMFDPAFYTSGDERFLADVVFPAALPFLSVVYDSEGDVGRVVFSTGPGPAVPDTNRTLLLLCVGMTAVVLWRWRTSELSNAW